MTPAFRTVLRGYEPAQVDAEVGTLQQALDAARAELGELTVQLKEARQGQAGLEADLSAARSRARPCPRPAASSLARARSPRRACPLAPPCLARVVTAPAWSRARPSVPLASGFELS